MKLIREHSYKLEYFRREEEIQTGKEKRRNKRIKARANAKSISFK